MDPISATVDKTEELLGHSPHPAIVALPIGAWAVSNICDVLAMISGDDRYDDAARISMAVGLVGAAGAVVTGIRDYSYIPPERPSHSVATTHALGNSVVGTMYMTSYLMRERAHQGRRPTSMAARLLGLAAGGLALYTAWLGGVLVEEYGEAVKPVMEQQEDNQEGDAHPRGRQRLSSGAPLGQDS